MDSFDPKKIFDLEKSFAEAENPVEPKTAMQEDMDKANEKEQGLRAFLDNIKMIESSGGKNFDHRVIDEGIHAGHAAAGSYGLMPNTMQEVINRKLQSGKGEDLKYLLQKKPDELKKHVESNPEIEERLARALGERVLERQGDPEKAAYSWMYGHNLRPEDIEKRKYQEDPYVQKYNRYNKTRNLIGSNDE